MRSEIKEKLRRIITQNQTLFRLVSYLLMPRGLWKSFKRREFDMQGDLIALKAHHLFCLARYNAVKNFHPALPLALRKIKSRPELKIKVVAGVDDVCLACPYQHGNHCARFNVDLKDLPKDEKFLRILRLSDNEVIPAKKLFSLMREKISLETLKKLCPDCTPELCFKALSQKSWWD